jgi:hypothetical protein
MDFDERKPILCGRCRVPVEISAPSGWETKVHCPTCGQSETLEEARREASKHTAHVLLSNMLRGLRTNDRPELFFHFVEGGDSRPGRRALV